ncbi:membrane protein insertion efficiency factor YidD [Helicobacter sp. 11S03491-1]|nr:membrane protein insertion efficiency factor YidD [Helicobacter sp. 11S03491-1]
MFRLGVVYMVEKLVFFYQKFISPLLPGSCRYYPTCSEYALWCIRFESPLCAFLKICLRVLKCNQFFVGGIDYPIGHRALEVRFSSPQKILFWLVPLAHTSKSKFYIIKSL